jgi:hypothetical protein
MSEINNIPEDATKEALNELREGLFSDAGKSSSQLTLELARKIYPITDDLLKGMALQQTLFAAMDAGPMGLYIAMQIPEHVKSAAQIQFEVFKEVYAEMQKGLN